MLIKIIIFLSVLLLANATNCNKLLHELANCQSKFVFCVTANSVPVTMCNGCKEEHDNLLLAYDSLTTPCNATYFDKDRLNLVQSTESLLTGLWTKAYCDDCFNNDHIHMFESKSSDFYICLENNHVKQCDKCKDVYTELNNFYISLDLHNNGEVCFDMQDSMNRTRNKWSNDLKCCLRQYNVLYFSIALSITTFITLMFYSCTYLLTKRQERNHGVLNDEDPLFNSPSPSSASAITCLNIANDQTQIHRQPPNNQVHNLPASTSQAYENNKLSKAAEETEDSSDDDLITNSSMVKEKLK